MSTAAFTVPSFAKINLDLRVIGKRPDGYHELCTVFQTVSLCDEIRFAPSDSLSLNCDSAAVPVDSSNLILRAAEVLRERYDVKAGARIELVKRIPAPGGLGGGSSNAAVTLMALAKLWGISVTDADLHEIAAGLGADVPFFFYGGTALGRGRGTEIEPIEDFDGKFMLIVTPKVEVSTSVVFAALDAPNLTTEDPNRILRICRFEAGMRDFRRTELKNDLEPVTFARYPEVAAAKEALLSLGAGQALMSGSGASVFGIFEKEETRQAAMKALDKKVNWRKFAVATISRKEYREALNSVF